MNSTILDQLIHEVRSPLSLVLIKAEAEEDQTLERHAMRMECLLRYAAAAATDTIQAAVLPLRENVLAAVDALSHSWTEVEADVSGIDEYTRAVLPEDDDLRVTFLAAWLETALYGTATTSLTVEGATCGPVVLLEARGPGRTSRGLANVRARLCTRAAAEIARILGGRLIVSASLPQATLALPKVAGMAQSRSAA